MSEIGNRVALCVVGNCLIADFGKQVFPLFVPVGIRYTVLGLDVTVVIIGHCIDNCAVYGFGKQLTEFVVGIFGYAVDRICYFRNSFFRVVFVGNSSSARIGYLTYELRCRAGFQLLAGLMFFCKLSRKITELS